MKVLQAERKFKARVKSIYAKLKQKLLKDSSKLLNGKTFQDIYVRF